MLPYSQVTNHVLTYGLYDAVLSVMLPLLSKPGPPSSPPGSVCEFLDILLSFPPLLAPPELVSIAYR